LYKKYEKFKNIVLSWQHLSATRVKTLRLMQVVNKLLQVGSEQDAAILCGPLAAMLSTILFTLVRTILLTADERTRPEQHCWNN
jgi:hypothetical protein